MKYASSRLVIILALVCLSGGHRIEAGPLQPSLAILIVSDETNVTLVARENQVVEVVDQARKERGLSKADLPVLVYHFNKMKEADYCRNVLGIKESDLLFVGLVTQRGLTPIKIVSRQKNVIDAKAAVSNVMLYSVTSPPSPASTPPSSVGTQPSAKRAPEEPGGNLSLSPPLQPRASVTSDAVFPTKERPWEIRPGLGIGPFNLGMGYGETCSIFRKIYPEFRQPDARLTEGIGIDGLTLGFRNYILVTVDTLLPAQTANGFGIGSTWTEPIESESIPPQIGQLRGVNWKLTMFRNDTYVSHNVQVTGVHIFDPSSTVAP